MLHHFLGSFLESVSAPCVSFLFLAGREPWLLSGKAQEEGDVSGGQGLQHCWISLELKMDKLIICQLCHFFKCNFYFHSYHLCILPKEEAEKLSAVERSLQPKISQSLLLSVSPRHCPAGVQLMKLLNLKISGEGKKVFWSIRHLFRLKLLFSFLTEGWKLVACEFMACVSYHIITGRNVK